MWKEYDYGRRLIMIVEEYDDDGKGRTVDVIGMGKDRKKRGGAGYVVRSVE